MAKGVLLTPELAEEVRQIARQVFQEKQPDLMKAMEREFRPWWAPQPQWPDWVETVLRELAEAQKRTEARVEELAEAQKRTEERLTRLEITVQELAEAQKRTEERLTRLEITVQELAEAQKRTEARVEELAEAQQHIEERLTRLEITVQELVEAQKRTAEQIAALVATQQRFEMRLQHVEERLDRVELRLGRVEDLLGVDIEVDAQDILTYVLEQKGYRLLDVPRPWDLDGEIDVVVPVETPDGECHWVLVEAKSRARFKELRRWAQRLQSEGFIRQLEERGASRPYQFYLFGLRVYSLVVEEARRLGLGVLSPEGEEVAPVPIR